MQLTLPASGGLAFCLHPAWKEDKMHPNARALRRAIIITAHTCLRARRNPIESTRADNISHG
eukprot:5679653-Amphidinium_carterae.2